jgi:hypothetical protein
VNGCKISGKGDIKLKMPMCMNDMKKVQAMNLHVDICVYIYA